MEFTIFDHLFFILICIVIPVMSLASDQSSKTMEDIGGIDEEDLVKLHFPQKKQIYYTNGLLLITGALIVVAMYFFGSRSFTKLGFTEPYLDNIVIGHALGLLIIYLVDTYKNYSEYKNDLGELKKLDHIMPTTWNDYKHFIFIAFAAGICEEVVFRGFLMNYIQNSMNESMYASITALTIPSLAFAAGHLYQGAQAVFKIFAISLLFGAVYMYSGSLYIVMAIHVLIDLLSGAVLVYIHSDRSKQS
jgi:uncharacterized protein